MPENPKPTVLRWMIESSEWSDAHPIQAVLAIIITGVVLGWVLFAIGF